MADKFITVATFDRTFEGQLAKNLLENEGIESILSGDVTADVLTFGQAGSRDQVVLQVREQDAQRATGILAAVAAAKLDADWEEQAESGAGVWLCSICGEPVSNRLSVCYSCQTPREGIRAAIPRQSTAIQPNPSTLPAGEDVQKRDEIARVPVSATTPPPTPTIPESEAAYEAPLPALRGDDLARRAFFAAMIGAAMLCLLSVTRLGAGAGAFAGMIGAATLCLLALSWFFLLQAVSFDGPKSPRGTRQLYGALAINALCLLALLLLCAGLKVG